MTRRAKREREAERRRRAIEAEKTRFASRLETDPGVLREFFDELVDRGLTTEHEIQECLLRMDRTTDESEKMEIKNRFISTIMRRVEVEADPNL
jgi:hypothetical protein